ncbi:MAG: hypothetical protein GX661_04735 [Acholeplasmataceae bacterium]|nr:hypothetical protein [Acholeplasmataceae bacterium]
MNLFKSFGIQPNSLQEIPPYHQGDYYHPSPNYQHGYFPNDYAPQPNHYGSDLSKRDFKNANQYYLGRIKNFLKKQI